MGQKRLLVLVWAVSWILLLNLLVNLFSGGSHGRGVGHPALAQPSAQPLAPNPIPAPPPTPVDAGRRLPLFPELEMRPEALAESRNPVRGRLSLGSLWFQNPGNRCAGGFDTLALAWLATRLMFVCPYALGRTSLGLEASPEIQWPTGESLSLSPRPGLRLAHIQNTALTEDLVHFFRLSYKLAWQDRAASDAPSIGARSVSIALLQDWSDFFDSTYSTGLFFRLRGQRSEVTPLPSDSQTESELLLDFEQSLPLSLREFGVVRGTALAKWSRIGVTYRARSGDFHWGGGLNYGSLGYERLQIAFLYPTLHLAYDFGG